MEGDNFKKTGGGRNLYNTYWISSHWETILQQVLLSFLSSNNYSPKQYQWETQPKKQERAFKNPMRQEKKLDSFISVLV